MDITRIYTGSPIHGASYFILLVIVLVGLYIIAWGYKEQSGARHRIFPHTDVLAMLAVAFLGHYSGSPIPAVAAVAGLGYWRKEHPTETPLAIQALGIVLAGIAALSALGAVLFALTVAFFYYRLMPSNDPMASSTKRISDTGSTPQS